MNYSCFNRRSAPTRIMGTLLAAYWLLAAITLCVPMTVEAGNSAPMNEHASMSHSMDDMPCCDDAFEATPADCDNGVPDSAQLTELKALSTPLRLQLLFILAEPAPLPALAYQPFSLPRTDSYPRRHLALNVLLD